MTDSPTDEQLSPGVDRLDRRQQRRLAFVTVARIVLVVTLTLIAYAIAPGEPTASFQVAVRVVFALLIVAGATAFAARSVWNADYPALRAMEGIAALVVILVVGFAAVYLPTSASDPEAFSEGLDHISALYFSMTTALTVGFGDIAPKSNAARIAVMVQMVANVVVISVAAKLLMGVARRRSRTTD